MQLNLLNEKFAGVLGRLLGIRALVILSMLAWFMLTRQQITEGIMIFTSLMVIGSAIIVYFWAGWSAAREGFSLMDTAKIGLGASLVTGVVSMSVGSGGRSWDVIVMAWGIAGEMALGMVFVLLGATIARRVRVE